MTLPLVGRRKGYRPNRICVEENHDQQEANDLPSKRQKSINANHDQPAQSYQQLKIPRTDTSIVTSSSLKLPSQNDQGRHPTLNIRSDLKQQSTSLDSANLMSSVHKGLDAFGGDNKHQVD